MIKSHEKFRIPDENKANEMVFEVNWNPSDPKTNGCKMIKVTFPNGQEALIRKEHLHAVLFAVGNEEEQRKLIPQVVNRSRHYETVVSVKANKDIKKGEQITFPLSLTLPTFSEEIIAEAKRDAFKSGKILEINK